MKNSILFFAGALIFFGSSVARSWQSESLGGEESKFTSALREYLKLSADPYQVEIVKDDEQIGFRCFSDQDNPFAVGVGQYYSVAASLVDVAQHIEDFDRYPKWFDGLVSCSAVREEPRRIKVSIEQYVPIPFVSNVRFQMIYAIESSPKQKLYRYQVAQRGSVISYDGIILLSQIDETHTEVIEYDFINAEWGVAKIRGKTAIWSDTLRGIYQTDLALKLRSENKSESDEIVLRTSVAKAKKKAFADCLANKIEFAP